MYHIVPIYIFLYACAILTLIIILQIKEEMKETCKNNQLLISLPQ